MAVFTDGEIQEKDLIMLPTKRIRQLSLPLTSDEPARFDQVSVLDCILPRISTTGLQAHYRLDADGSDETGTYPGITSMLPVSGYQVVGRGNFNFLGDGNFVDIPSASSLNLSTGMTLACWVKFVPGTQPAANGIIIDKSTTVSTSRAYQLGILNSTSQIFCAVRGVNGIVYTPPITDSNWHHIAATQHADRTVKIYLDGVLVDQSIGSGFTNASGFNLKLGKSSSPTYLLNGQVDDVYLYDRPLAVYEIAALMGAPAEIITTNPLNPLEAFIRTLDATPTVALSFSALSPAYGEAFLGSVKVIAKHDSTADIFVKELSILFTNGTEPTFAGPATLSVLSTGGTSPTWDATITYPFPGQIDIIVTGAAGEDIRWHVILDLESVRTPNLV
jgi:hypothetical protein